MRLVLNTIKKIIPKNFLKKIKPFYHFGLSFLAACYHGFPSNKLVVIGVTGTSGKTSTTYLMAKAFNNSGSKAGYTSTAMFGDGEKEWLNDKKMTMMGPFFTQKMIAKMVKNNCHYAIIETTSEGIVQSRHRFINYDILVFTGLYPEHIESHGGFDNYKQAKGQLFDYLKKCKVKYLNKDNKVVGVKNNLSKIELSKVKKTFILNNDNEHVGYFSSFWSEEKIFYSEKITDEIEENFFYYNNISVGLKGTSFNFIFQDRLKKEAVNHSVKLKLWGEFNVLNSVPVLILPFILKINTDKYLAGLEEIKNIPGRLEIIDVGQKFLTIVDYAYEPVAMEKIYNLLDAFKSDLAENGYDGKIVHVLGSAGGGRDKSRRPIMGGIAGSRADFVVVSNEDPYDENPLDIINQVASGARESKKVEGVNLFRVLDRREAIKKALSLIEEGDILLITGKGCEQAICVQDGKKIPWDDRIVAKEEIVNKMQLN